MPKLLTDLRIDEVSSVDSGAGEGVKVVLMKRAPRPNPTQTSTGDRQMTDDERAGDTARSKRDSTSLDDAGRLRNAIAAHKRLSPEHRGYFDRADFDDDEAQDFLDSTPDERDQFIADNPEPEPPAAVAKALAEAAVMKAEYEKLREERDVAKFEKRAAAIGLPASAGATLRRAYAGEEASIHQLEGVIKSLTRQVEAGALFEEFGKASDKAASAADELAERVKHLRKSHPRLSEAQAFSKVYTDPANGDLKRRYDLETSPLRRR